MLVIYLPVICCYRNRGTSSGAIGNYFSRCYERSEFSYIGKQRAG